MSKMHWRQTALIFASPVLLAACSGSPAEHFGETSQGSTVTASNDACLLKVEGSTTDLVLLVPREGDGVRLSFPAGEIVVDRAAQTADFGFLVSRVDGTIVQLAQESISYVDDGQNPFFVADAPLWMATDLAELDNVSFVWDGLIASMAAPREGWAEEAAMLAECLGKPLSEVGPVAA